MMPPRRTGTQRRASRGAPGRRSRSRRPPHRRTGRPSPSPSPASIRAGSWLGGRPPYPPSPPTAAVASSRAAGVGGPPPAPPFTLPGGCRIVLSAGITPTLSLLLDNQTVVNNFPLTVARGESLSTGTTIVPHFFDLNFPMHLTPSMSVTSAKLFPGQDRLAVTSRSGGETTDWWLTVSTGDVIELAAEGG